MKFTPELPKEPGDYAWKRDDKAEEKLFRVFRLTLSERLAVWFPEGYELIEDLGGLWCRLVPEDDWMPIESAPHEELVLLFSPDGTIETGMASRGWKRDGVSNMSWHGRATHWRPLPKPPKGGGK